MGPIDPELAPSFHAEVLSTVSHDIRAPLGVILGSINELASPALGALTDEQRGLLQLVRRSSEKLVRLAANVSFLQRLVSETPTFSLQRVDARVFLRRAVEPFERSSELGRLRVTVDAPDARVDVDADPESLTHALVNLVANAVRFGRAEVRIALERQEGGVVFAIEDDGPGVAPTQHPHLFDPHARVRAPDAHAPVVRGLGLLVVKAIADGHHGQVRSERRTGDRGGARVVIALPTPR